MKKIASDKGSLDTDTSRDYVCTEWDGVRRFAEVSGTKLRLLPPPRGTVKRLSLAHLPRLYLPPGRAG